jgi:hypothetical protein
VIFILILIGCWFGKLAVNGTGSVAALLGFFEVEQNIFFVVVTVVDIPEDRVVDINRLVEGFGSRVRLDRGDDLFFGHWSFLVLVVVVFRVIGCAAPVW